MDVASLSFVVAIVHRLHLEEQELQNFPSQVIVQNFSPLNKNIFTFKFLNLYS